MAAIQNPSTKASTLFTPEIAQRSYQFKIDGYSLKKGLGVGNFIRSDPFNIGGHIWCVRYYPDGIVGGDGEAFIAVTLELLSKNSEVRAQYKFALVDEVTNSTWSRITMTEPVMFSTLDMSKPKYAWGIPHFKRRSELEGSVYLRNDSILITCDVNVRVVKAGMPLGVQVPPSDWSANFGKLLESGEGSDVTFSVQGEVFPAHKAVLAVRSPVFNAQLFGLVGEGNRERITIEDMKPPVFKALLHFVYMDSMPVLEHLGSNDKKEMINHLLVAADRYAMERLKLICEDILCNSLDIENAATTLSLADQHNCPRLKDACIQYINSSDRVNEGMSSEGFLHLKRACPSAFADALEKKKLNKYRKI